MWPGNVFSCICLCVCLSVCNAVTFEILDIESLFLVCRYNFRISRWKSYIRVIGSRSSHRNKRIFFLLLYIIWCQTGWCVIIGIVTTLQRGTVFILNCQGLRSKKPVHVSCLQLVCLQLKSNLVFCCFRLAKVQNCRQSGSIVL